MGERLFGPPVIASNGDGSIILWQRGRDLLASVLARGGAASAAVKIANLVEVPASVVWTGMSYIVAWPDIFAHALRWTPLDASGNPTGSPGMLPLLPATTTERAAIARVGDGAIIAWAHIAGPANTDIRALRVAANGSQEGEPFTIAASQLSESALAMAGGGAGARVAYQRPIDFPGTFGLPRVFTREIGVVPLPRRRPAR